MSGKFERSDWFILGQEFPIRTVSMKPVVSCVFSFCFRKPSDPISKHGLIAILTNLTYSIRNLKGRLFSGPHCHYLGPIFPRSALALG